MEQVNNSEHCYERIVLFDEQGTPTFRNDRETNLFLGVTAIYNPINEVMIFDSCKELFGLDNCSPVRNNEIGRKRANDISDLLITLPIEIMIASINLDNIELQNSVILYENLGTVIRNKYRGIKGRPLAHFLHSHILSECLFESIRGNVESEKHNITYSIFIDAWSMPKSDKRTYVIERPKSIETNMNKLFAYRGFPFRVKLSPISLLDKDNTKKRFIGIIASIISRAFLPIKNTRYSKYPLDIILRDGHNAHLEITQKTIEFVRDCLDDFSRNPPIF
jgi:hypothetical protein